MIYLLVLLPNLHYSRVICYEAICCENTSSILIYKTLSLGGAIPCLSVMELEELYQELIVDHSKRPRCFGQLSKPDVKCSLFNPLCGDQIELSLVFKDNRIDEIAFSGHGCSISQAAASMMAELLKGKSLLEVKELSKLYQGMIRGNVAENELVPLGDIVALQGVKKFSTRIKCAMLAWEAIDRAVKQYEEDSKSSPRASE